MRGIAVIVIVFAVAVAITNPIGNFPLNDDWDFAVPTWDLVHTGHVQHTPFTMTTAVLQYFWGALWTMLFGQSSTVLRASTLFLALASAILIYAILRRSDVPERLATFAALAFLFHPLMYWASFTYMTDVPELFLSVAAFALLNEALKRDSDRWLIVAVLVAIASYFVRQIGLLNVIAPLVAIRRKKITIAYGAACALEIALLLSGAIGVSPEQLQVHMIRPGEIAIGALHYGFLNVQNAALFFLPLTILIFLQFAVRNSRLAVPSTPLRTANRELRTKSGGIALAIVSIWFIAIAWHLIALGRPIPYPIRGNLFINFGLGPPTLRDTFVFGMPYPLHIGYAWRIALMIVSTFLAIVVAAFLVRARSLAAIYCLLGTAMMMLLHIYFDRYSIDTMWPLAIAIPIAVKDIRVRFAAIPLVLMIIFSIAGTAEYLAWNRARWDAFRWLQSRGVTLDQMDGGYEINAMLALRTGQRFLGKPGFAVRDDRYIISFNAVPGYKTLAMFPYRWWIPIYFRTVRCSMRF